MRILTWRLWCPDLEPQSATNTLIVNFSLGNYVLNISRYMKTNGDFRHFTTVNNDQTSLKMVSVFHHN